MQSNAIECNPGNYDGGRGVLNHYKTTVSAVYCEMPDPLHLHTPRLAKDLGLHDTRTSGRSLFFPPIGKNSFEPILPTKKNKIFLACVVVVRRAWCGECSGFKAIITIKA